MPVLPLVAVLSILAISIIVQASSLSPGDHAHVLLKRQIPGSYPAVCNPACAAITSILSDPSCATNIVPCACTPAAGIAEEMCLDCIAAVDPSIPTQATLDAYSSVCSGGGMPFNPPLSLAPSAPGTFSVTAPTSSAGAGSTVTAGTASINPSQVAPYTQSFPPAPTQSAGLSNPINQTVDADDPRITTSGPDWNTTQSSCDSTKSCKKCSVPGEKLTFKFTGSAVFMSAAQSATSGQYIVTIDNSAPVVVDGFSDSQNPKCGFGWSSFGLKDTNHTVVVTTSGPSPLAIGNGGKAPTFELDGFVITQSPSSSGASMVSLSDMKLPLAILLTTTTFFVIDGLVGYI